MRCPHCNSPVPSGGNTCLDCGKRFYVRSTTSTRAARQREEPVQSGTRTLSRRRSTIRLNWLQMLIIFLVWAALLAVSLFSGSATVNILFGGSEGAILENNEQVMHEDGSWEQVYTYSDGGCAIYYYDAEGSLYQEDYLMNDELRCNVYYEDGRYVGEDQYEDGDYIGTWYTEYVELDDGDCYLSCAYFVYAGMSTWTHIYYYDADGENIGEVYIDPSDGTIVDAWGTDLPGNDLSLLTGD